TCQPIQTNSAGNQYCPASYTAPAAPTCPGAGLYSGSASSCDVAGKSTCMANGCSATPTDCLGGTNPVTQFYNVTSTASCVPAASAPSTSTAAAPTTANLIPGSSVGSDGLAPSSPADCPAGTGFGAINNATGCFPSGSTINGKSGQSTSAGGSSTSNNTYTYNSSNNTWSQTDTNTNSSGGTSQTTTNGGGSVAPGGASGSGSGTGTTPTDQTMGTDSFDDSVPPAMNNAPSSISGLPSMTVTQYFGSASYSCPFVNQSFSMAGQTVTLPMSDICNYTNYIHYLVVFAAFIVAIRVILT
ncbi:MAG: hypothetical protein ACYC3O_11465, partial [Burkholderiales bacterium]